MDHWLGLIFTRRGGGSSMQQHVWRGLIILHFIPVGYQKLFCGQWVKILQTDRAYLVYSLRVVVPPLISNQWCPCVVYNSADRQTGLIS